MDAHGCAQQPANRPPPLIGEIVRRHAPEFQRTHVLTPDQRRVLGALAACRTARLGGHLDVCPGCGFCRPSYNSCRNRHCPNCQSQAAAAWVEARMQRVLPVPYFHLVFTLPEQLRPIVHRNRELLFDLLFQAASQTLLTLAADARHLGATIGITAVLHTWTRDLSFHPHLHCVVTGGGLAADAGSWITPAHSRFLFPVHVMSALFRGKFMARLVRLYEGNQLDLGGNLESLREPDVFRFLKDSLYRKGWVVYAKRPFAAPRHVFAYLGRYTHRVAISNGRIREIAEDTVRFSTRGDKTVALGHQEFLRRLVQHVLPAGFVKIRHYGLLAPRHADTKLQAARRLLGVADPQAIPEASSAPIASTSAEASPLSGERPSTLDPVPCPLCARAFLLRLPIPEQRPPPKSSAARA